MLPERATMQASTSGQVQGCTTAVKHRQQHTANVCCFRAIPKRQHSTQYNVTTHAKRSSNDGDKQSFNPKDVEELKNLMPDPQDSLFDDSTLVLVYMTEMCIGCSLCLPHHQWAVARLETMTSSLPA